MLPAGQTCDAAVNKGGWPWTESHRRQHCCCDRSQLEPKVRITLPPEGTLFSSSPSRTLTPYSHTPLSWDLQAQDRAFRLGQRRDVTVFRFIAGGTIEENQHMRQIYKQQLQVCILASPGCLIFNPATSHFRCQNLATRDAAQEHRFFNPNDDFLGIKNMLVRPFIFDDALLRAQQCSSCLTRAQSFQPFKARDLVTDGDKSADGLEFRVQKDLVSRSSEDAPVVDRDEVKSDRDGDDFGMLTVAAEVLHDAGATSVSFRGRPFTFASQV